MRHTLTGILLHDVVALRAVLRPAMIYDVARCASRFQHELDKPLLI